MPTYLIKSPHTAEDCSKIAKLTLAAGYLTHFHWGCKAGDHTAWAIIEADSAGEALLSVPTVVREKCQAIEVVQFDPHDVAEW